MTYKIYAEVYILNLNLNIKSQAVKYLSKNLALESHQKNTPINCDNFFKSVAKSPFMFTPECTSFVFDLSFFFLF